MPPPRCPRFSQVETLPQKFANYSQVKTPPPKCSRFSQVTPPMCSRFSQVETLPQTFANYSQVKTPPPKHSRFSQVETPPPTCATYSQTSHRHQSVPDTHKWKHCHHLAPYVRGTSHCLLEHLLIIAAEDSRLQQLSSKHVFIFISYWSKAANCWCHEFWLTTSLQSHFQRNILIIKMYTESKITWTVGESVRFYFRLCSMICLFPTGVTNNWPTNQLACKLFYIHYITLPRMITASYIAEENTSELTYIPLARIVRVCNITMIHHTWRNNPPPLSQSNYVISFLKEFF